MRIALVGSFPQHPVTFVGGVEASTWNLIQGLRAVGETDIHVVALDSSIDAPQHTAVDGVRYYYLPSANRWQTVTLFRRDSGRILETLDAIAPDVVHAQSSQIYGYIALRSRHPVVVSVHGIVAEEARFLSGKRDRLRAFVRNRFIQRHCVRKSPHLIQPTRYPERYFAGMRSGRWHDTGNAIGPDFFSVERRPEPRRALYAGAVIRRKRLHDLIGALAQIPHGDLRLRVAGPTPDPGYRGELQVRIDQLGLHHRVEFLGPLNPQEMLEEYRQCTALVLPSGQETSPMVIAEAMATGTPVVATQVGGVTDLVDEGRTGLTVPVGDVDGMAAAIARLVENPDLAEKMGRLARQQANDRFRSDVVAAKVLTVYTAAVSGENARK